MATEPSLALQGAIVAALKADGTVTGLVGTRVYDPVPPSPSFPYVAWGEDQTLNDSNECKDEFEVFTVLHIWSRTKGYPETKRIAHAIVGVLHDATLTLPDNALVLIEHDSTRYLADPDGITTHGVVTFHSHIQAA